MGFFFLFRASEIIFVKQKALPCIKDFTKLPLFQVERMLVMEATSNQNNITGAFARAATAGESFFRSLINDSLDGILLTDIAGIIKFASPSAKLILGYDEQDLLGKNAFSFVNPEDRELAIDAFLKETYRTPEVKFISIRLLTKDGRWLWCMVRGHNLLDNAEIQSIAIYFHDDTPRKNAITALRKSEDLLRHLVANIQVGVALIDNEGKIQVCNQAFSDLFLSSLDDLPGQSVFDVLKDVINEEGKQVALEERPIYSAIHGNVISRDAVLGVYREKANDRIWLMINTEPVLDENGNLLHVIYSAKDISERKRLEAELLQKQLRYQKQITQATIESQEKERREIGKELHDNVGQQLTTVKLFLELARNSANDATSELLNLALKGIADVLNDIRSMSRALVPLTLKDLGLAETLCELRDSMNRSASIQVKLEFADFGEEHLDDMRKLAVFRIVQEQLDHITKHANASMATIRLSSQAENIVLEMEHNGVGRDPEAKGLSSIHNRVDLLGGQLHMESASGQGHRVMVTLPNK